MKILIYGAGVIGCTYGWQLTKAGHEISVLVRKSKRQTIEQNGISIYCRDYRNGEEATEKIVFRPKIIDTLTSNNDFEYIIVATNHLNLEEVLLSLKDSAGKAHILFFQNIWYDDLEKINTTLTSGKYFFGFPFMAGGGKNEKELTSIISGSKYSKTMLGEIDGEITPRIQKIAEAMAKANMRPFISKEIKTWLIPHCAFITILSIGILKAGSTMEAFLNNAPIIKETIMGIRESFHICKELGINPKKEKVNKLYYLPLFISVPIIKKIFTNVSMQAMFDGFLGHSTDEITMLIDQILSDGEKYSVPTVYLKRLYGTFSLFKK